jgi:hypothetical protein
MRTINVSSSILVSLAVPSAQLAFRAYACIIFDTNTGNCWRERQINMIKTIVPKSWPQILNASTRKRAKNDRSGARAVDGVRLQAKVCPHLLYAVSPPVLHKMATTKPFHLVVIARSVGLIAVVCPVVVFSNKILSITRRVHGDHGAVRRQGRIGHYRAGAATAFGAEIEARRRVIAEQLN